MVTNSKRSKLTYSNYLTWKFQVFVWLFCHLLDKHILSDYDIVNLWKWSVQMNNQVIIHILLLSKWAWFNYYGTCIINLEVKCLILSPIILAYWMDEQIYHDLSNGCGFHYNDSNTHRCQNTNADKTYPNANIFVEERLYPFTIH